MATITVTISDDEQENGQVNVDFDAEESIPQEIDKWTPAQVFASHLHDYLCKIRHGVCAEKARQLKNHH